MIPLETGTSSTEFTAVVPLAPPALDLVDQLANLTQASPTHLTRHRRDKVAAATQASYEGLFDAQLPGLSLAERLLVALYACRLSNAPTMALHYQTRLQELASKEAIDVSAKALAEAGANGDLSSVTDPRLQAILRFTRTLILSPIDGDKAALQALPAAGISTPAVVTLSQLIAFLSYQIRLVAGLAAMQAARKS
jgi:CMD domain protein